MEPPFEDYPFEGRFLDLDGVRMHYLDEGAGTPVLMVHGNPTWSYYYRHLVLALRDRHRVIVPDHVGCGLSDKPDDDSYPYRLERRVQDLERLVDHAKLDGKVTLVVHDWGGMIGMAWAARHPERIERLVILNSAAFHLPAGKRVPLSLRLARSALGGFLAQDRPGVGVKHYPSQPYRMRFATPPAERRAPLLGEHTAEVLRERLGMSDEELAELERDDVIGTVPIAAR